MAKTIRDLAKELNCSYEAVRKQTKRYKKELQEHIYVHHKTQFLDDYACDFIKGKRLDTPAVISRIEYDEAVELLKEKYTELLEKYNDLRDEKELLLAEYGKIKALEGEKDKRVEEAEKTAERAKFELSEALEELQEAKERPISFKEYWERRKNGKKTKSNKSDSGKE